MKAMLLAAGRGKRMRPLTDTTPKPLLRIGKYSLIEHRLLALQQAGIRDCIINIAYLGEQIRAELGDGQQYGVRIQYSDEGTAALETAGGIIQALGLLGDEPFMVINADIWTDYPLAQLPANPVALAHLVLVDNPAEHPQGDFALVGQQVKLDSEPRFTFSGIAVYRPAFFADYFPGKQPLRPLLENAIQAGQVTGEYYTGIWSDIGTPERLQMVSNNLAI